MTDDSITAMTAIERMLMRWLGNPAIGNPAMGWTIEEVDRGHKLMLPLTWNKLTAIRHRGLHLRRTLGKEGCGMMAMAELSRMTAPKRPQIVYSAPKRPKLC